MPHKQSRFPSVTQIIGILDKPFLKRWYGTVGWEEAERIKKESAILGTSIHEEVSRYLTEGVLFENQSKFVQVFSRHYAQSGCKPVEVEPEEPYESKKYKYSGTFDWVEKDPDGTLVIADLKVTNQMYPEMGLQLAAYAQLYNEKHHSKIVKGRIYRIDKKTGRLQIKEWDDLPELFKVFKALIPVWQWLNK